VSEKISAVLIVKDEETLVGRCLRSVAGLDEAVVLDTGSEDDTVARCEALGARVRRAEPASPFHFAEARNLALAEVRTPWAFTIDADEVLRPGGVPKMRRAVAEGGDKAAFAVTFINHPENDPGSRSIVTRKVKLFRKDACEWRYRVHERLFDRASGKVLDFLPDAVGDLSDAVSVEHLPPGDKARRHGQNVELLEMCVRESPEYTRAFRHLGQELMLAKRWEEALPYLAHYAEKTDEGPLHASEALTHVGRCLGEMGREDEALVWFGRAAEAAPDRREPLYHAALRLIKACRLDEAVQWIERMMAIPPKRRPNSEVDLPGVWGPEPGRMLRFCQTEISRARAAWGRAHGGQGGRSGA